MSRNGNCEFNTYFVNKFSLISVESNLIFANNHFGYFTYQMCKQQMKPYVMHKIPKKNNLIVFGITTGLGVL